MPIPWIAIAPSVPPITFANKLAESSDNGALATGFTTTSYAYQNNQLYLLTVNTRLGAGAPLVTSVTGGGITWVDAIDVPNTSATQIMTVFRGLVTSGASTGALSITCALAPTAIKWTLDEFTNTDLTGTNGSGAVVQSHSGNASTGNGSVTGVAAFANPLRNVSWTAWSHNAIEGITPEAGYTLLGDQADVVGPAISLSTSAMIGEDLTPTATWATNSVVTWRGAALEIASGF